MRFAAAALMAGLVFLAGAISGFGSSSPGPPDLPQAIRLSGTTAQVPSADLPAAVPDPQVASAAVGSPEPAVAVAHSVVPVHLVPAGTPATAASQNRDAGSSGASSGPASSTQQVPATVVTVEPPVVSTTFSPVPASPSPSPTPSPTAKPGPSPTAKPTPTPSPSPTPSASVTPTPSPTPTRRGMFRNFLHLR